jgi:hypothetical protein
MKEHVEENEDLSQPPQADSDVVSLIKKMQQQLNYLEKKIDLLIGQSPEKSFGEKRFSKPFRPSFGHGAHHGKRDFNRGPRKEGFSSGYPRKEGFSHDRPRESGFSQDRPRERSFNQDRPFDRKPSTGPRGFGHGDKPFFQHRKGPRPHRESR